MRRLLTHVVCMLLWMGAAHADSGDLAVGATAHYRPLRAAGVGAAMELGMADFAALRLEGAFGLNPNQLHGAVGATVSWDVLSWVPAATVGIGVGRQADTLHLRAFGRAEVRHFIAARTWFSVGGGIEWWKDAPWQAVVQLGIFQQLN